MTRGAAVAKTRLVELADFEAEYRRLVTSASERKDNTSCVACNACERCVECTFCTRSTALLRSHYCTGCDRCVASTHCRESRDLFACNHCDTCERCSQSSYLVRCVDCTSCTYCFGSVGLIGKDFHILNQPYSRSEYFALVAKLSKGFAATPRRPGPSR